MHFNLLAWTQHQHHNHKPNTQFPDQHLSLHPMLSFDLYQCSMWWGSFTLISSFFDDEFIHTHSSSVLTSPPTAQPEQQHGSSLTGWRRRRFLLQRLLVTIEIPQRVKQSPYPRLCHLCHWIHLKTKRVRALLKNRGLWEPPEVAKGQPEAILCSEKKSWRTKKYIWNWK